SVRVPGAQAAIAGQQGQASVAMIPLPRYNSILLAAPPGRMDDIIREIKKLDRPVAPQGGATAFPLKKAAAARVAPLLQQFYAQRYANETTAQNQIRITFDDSTNTVFVQAAPADLAEIRGLIERMDTMESPAVNDMRIVPLRYAMSDDLANLLLQAIAQGYTPATTTGAPGIVPGAAGGGVPGAAGAAIRPGGAGVGGAVWVAAVASVPPEWAARLASAARVARPKLPRCASWAGCLPIKAVSHPACSTTSELLLIRGPIA